MMDYIFILAPAYTYFDNISYFKWRVELAV